ASVPMAVGGYKTLNLERLPPGTDPAHLGFALWDSLFAVGAVLVLLRLFQRFVSGSGPLARFLSANAYAVYLVHALVVIAVAAALHPVELAPVPKFLIGLVLSASLSWLVSAALRRWPGARELL